MLSGSKHAADLLYACRCAHSLGDDADSKHAGAFCSVNGLDYIAIPQRGRCRNEQGLVAPSIEDVPQTTLEPRESHILMVDGETSIPAVLDHDLIGARNSGRLWWR